MQNHHRVSFSPIPSPGNYPQSRIAMVDRGFFPPAITLCGIAAIPLPCIPVPGMERTGGYFQKIIVSRDCHYYCAGSLQFQFLTFDTSGSRCFAGDALVLRCADLPARDFVFVLHHIKSNLGGMRRVSNDRMCCEARTADHKVSTSSAYNTL
jgi:hypothetical protein